MSKVGIENIKEVYTLIAASLLAVQAANADGKIGLEDLGQLMVILPAAGPAFDQIGQVGAELKDMDEAEEKELHDHIDAKFGEGKWEMIGEDLSLAGLHLASVYAKLNAVPEVA